MACLLTTGRGIPCKSAFGGIKTIWFADFGGLTGVTVDATSKLVTAVAGTVAGWTKWSVKGNSSLETTVTSSRENGTTFYTQTLNATFTYLDAKTQAELQIVATARPYVAVEDYYGNVFLCGFENGMELTGGTVVSGAAAGDLSGFTIVMEGMEELAPYFLNSASLLTPIDADIIDPTA
jgi:hypothetical protein|tara:strand:+ start:3460 stop:3996 length:537 start_codon:yes stop_codon:yes gene_type:complete